MKVRNAVPDWFLAYEKTAIEIGREAVVTYEDSQPAFYEYPA